jgi:hypothetical protein
MRVPNRFFVFMGGKHLPGSLCHAESRDERRLKWQVSIGDDIEVLRTARPMFDTLELESGRAAAFADVRHAQVSIRPKIAEAAAEHGSIGKGVGRILRAGEDRDAPVGGNGCVREAQRRAVDLTEFERRHG